MDGLFESSASVEVEDDWEKGDGSDGEGVGGVRCFSDASYRGEVGGRRPGSRGGFDSVVEVSKITEPLGWEAFKLDEAPAVGSGAGSVGFG